MHVNINIKRRENKIVSLDCDVKKFRKERALMMMMMMMMMMMCGDE